MKIQVVTVWIFLFILAWGHTTHSRCVNHQKNLLLLFRNSFDFSSLISWNASTDCCHWSGVQCSRFTGHVIGLDLSSKQLNGIIYNSSTLFSLQSLRSLNLAGNDDIYGEFPSAFGKLTSLTYLNLSYTSFSGQVPIQISHLVNLITLDISNVGSFIYDPPQPNLDIDGPALAKVTQNLTNLRELYLDFINIVANGSGWWKVFTSSLPHLQILSMSHCNLLQIHHSITNLPSLTVFRFDGNNLSAPIPEFFTKFKSLFMLSLSSCNLVGTVPQENFLVPTLTTLDLSNNDALQGSLPEFPEDGSLQNLVLASTNLSGLLPHSIGNLKNLKMLDLRGCNFHGSIPASLGGLHRLEFVDLSSNKFSGPIPSFSYTRKLTSLYLNGNNLSGSITATNWEYLLNLENVDLSQNSLTDNIPSSILYLPSVATIALAQNQFTGQLNEFGSLPSSKLLSLDLSKNKLEGLIPSSIFQLRGLSELDLSWNNFNGTLELNEILISLINLTSLSLSYNNLSIDAKNSNTTSTFPQLSELFLASCNLHALPEFLKNQSNLQVLDLSNNRIQGQVPIWIWNTSATNQNFTYLDLSWNNFVALEQPLLYILSFSYVDLHSNNLQGQFLGVPNAFYLDCSNNSITSINLEIHNSLSAYSQIEFLSLSRNKIQGTIPSSLCNLGKLAILDLEYNQLNGKIPNCLFGITSLRILNLGGNNLHGNIPDKFPTRCNLESFKVNDNFLQGQTPKSLANCKRLNVINLGNNGLYDTFPCHLQSLPNLQVLILRSNKLQGRIVCPNINSNWSSLQIMDLSSNHFNGKLSPLFFSNWGTMMAKSMVATSQPEYLGDCSCVSSLVKNDGYFEQLTLTYKGTMMTMKKILSIFTNIDLSNNSFHGEIPREMGELAALKGLNLSYNSFSGNIPSSIGNLSQLESLDLGCNTLSGNIPQELANLNYLSYLNLSFNKLSGLIPKSTQLQSFNATSYEGNSGLYGEPLTPSGRETHSSHLPQTPTGGTHWSTENQVEWMLRGAEVGLPVGIAIFVGPLLYVKRWRRWCSYQADRLLMKIWPRLFSVGTKKSTGKLRRRRSRNNRLRHKHG